MKAETNPLSTDTRLGAIPEGLGWRLQAVFFERSSDLCDRERLNAGESPGRVAVSRTIKEGARS